MDGSLHKAMTVCVVVCSVSVCVVVWTVCGGLAEKVHLKSHEETIAIVYDSDCIVHDVDWSETNMFI